MQVRHNIEVAHRLSLTPGKCENLHGHSMWVELTIYGTVDETGKLWGLEYGDVKTKFRSFLDTNFDHHLLLNASDPLLTQRSLGDTTFCYPGLQALDRDPTTENLAHIILDWAEMTFGLKCSVTVHETSVNAATAASDA